MQTRLAQVERELSESESRIHNLSEELEKVTAESQEILETAQEIEADRDAYAPPGSPFLALPQNSSRSLQPPAPNCPFSPGLLVSFLTDVPTVFITT